MYYISQEVLKFETLWFCLFQSSSTLLSVYVASMKTKLEELIIKDMTDMTDTDKDTDKLENVNEFLKKLLKVHIETDNTKQLDDNSDKVERNLNTMDNRPRGSNDLDTSQNMNIGDTNPQNKDRDQNVTNTDKVQGMRKDNIDKTDVVNESRCQLRETMAWAECGHQVNCPSTCQGKGDCTFPYCNSRRNCACREGK